jgi:3-dehydroquinate synthase
MIAATHIAVMTGRIDNNNALRISNAVLNLGLLPKIHARSRDLVRLLQSDKKTRNGKIHFVLPREIGKVEIVNDVPEKVVTVALDELRRLSKS